MKLQFPTEPSLSGDSASFSPEEHQRISLWSKQTRGTEDIGIQDSIQPGATVLKIEMKRKAQDHRCDSHPTVPAPTVSLARFLWPPGFIREFQIPIQLFLRRQKE